MGLSLGLKMTPSRESPKTRVLEDRGGETVCPAGAREGFLEAVALALIPAHLGRKFFAAKMLGV